MSAGQLNAQSDNRTVLRIVRLGSSCSLGAGGETYHTVLVHYQTPPGRSGRLHIYVTSIAHNFRPHNLASRIYFCQDTQYWSILLTKSTAECTGGHTRKKKRPCSDSCLPPQQPTTHARIDYANYEQQNSTEYKIGLLCSQDERLATLSKSKKREKI